MAPSPDSRGSTLTLMRDDADLETLLSRDGVRADDVAEGAAVTDLLGRLDPDRREAFVLTQLVGLSYPEAAGLRSSGKRRTSPIRWHWDSC